MRPIVIIKETNKDDKFELTEKELKELIEQTYEQGYADAKAEYNKPNWNYRDINKGTGGLYTYEDINPNNPHDVYGNPIPYCSGTTTSDPKDNCATLYSKSNDLVYRGWEPNDKLELPKQGEPIPCELNQTSAKPNPNITAWNMATSKQSNKDTYTLT